MTASAAFDDRYRLAPDAPVAASVVEAPIEDLPMSLVHLCERSERLFERVRRLDHRMYMQDELAIEAPHPVLSQFDRLRDAFS